MANGDSSHDVSKIRVGNDVYNLSDEKLASTVSGLASVAYTGEYADLNNKPMVQVNPTVEIFEVVSETVSGVSSTIEVNGGSVDIEEFSINPGVTANTVGNTTTLSFRIPRGRQGERSTVDAYGSGVEFRDAHYSNASVGFTYADILTGYLYLKLDKSTNNWSNPIPVLAPMMRAQYSHSTYTSSFHDELSQVMADPGESATERQRELYENSRRSNSDDIYVRWSNNGGNDWFPPYRFIAPELLVQYCHEPNGITSGHPENEWHYDYNCYKVGSQINNNDYQDFFMRMSNDGGRSWSQEPIRMVADIRFQYSDDGVHWHNTYRQSESPDSDNDYDRYIRFSYDGGQTWNDPILFKSSFMIQYNSVADANDSGWHYAYGGRDDVFLRISQTGGQEWGTAMRFAYPINAQYSQNGLVWSNNYDSNIHTMMRFTLGQGYSTPFILKGEDFKYSDFTAYQLNLIEAGVASDIKKDMAAVATTLDSNNNATVSVAQANNSTVFTFGIPRGSQGAQGSKGDKGDKGDKGNKGDKGDYPLVSFHVSDVDITTNDNYVAVTISEPIPIASGYQFEMGYVIPKNITQWDDWDAENKDLLYQGVSKRDIDNVTLVNGLNLKPGQFYSIDYPTDGTCDVTATTSAGVHGTARIRLSAGAGVTNSSFNLASNVSFVDQIDAGRTNVLEAEFWGGNVYIRKLYSL